MINNVVVALISADAVGTCFQKLNLVLNRSVFLVLKLVPNVERPAVGVVDIKPLRLVKTSVSERTVNKTACAAFFRSVFGSELHQRAEA